MRHYPDLSGTDPADHLLFDLGFSYGLLRDVKMLLEQVVGLDGVPNQPVPAMLVLHAEHLLEALGDLEQGRLQYRHEIYDNAAEAARRASARAQESGDSIVPAPRDPDFDDLMGQGHVDCKHD